MHGACRAASLDGLLRAWVEKCLKTDFLAQMNVRLSVRKMSGLQLNQDIPRVPCPWLSRENCARDSEAVGEIDREEGIPCRDHERAPTPRQHGVFANFWSVPHDVGKKIDNQRSEVNDGDDNISDTLSEVGKAHEDLLGSTSRFLPSVAGPKDILLSYDVDHGHAGLRVRRCFGGAAFWLEWQGTLWKELVVSDQKTWKDSTLLEHVDNCMSLKVIGSCQQK